MSDSALPEFPDAFLKPADGFIYGKPGQWAIIILLQPFELGGEAIKTRFDFDGFSWDISHPRDLAGKEFRFSAQKREDENIEGSIFLEGAHNPADVTRMVFGPANGDSLPVTIDVDIDFDFEGAGFSNRSATLNCMLNCREPKGVCGYRLIE